MAPDSKSREVAQQAADEARERARALVMRFGWNATAYQIVNPGIALWFSANGDAVVGFVRRARVRVVAGAPVCAPERLAAVVAEFSASARSAGDSVCYFGAGDRLEADLRTSLSHAIVGLGAQPSWDPERWPEIVARRSSLRAQLNRARNKDVRVALWPPERAENHPELRGCLDAWLATRGLPPLHFLVEPETLTMLRDRRVLVADRSGVIVGFLIASPVPARRGWLIEQIVRGNGAPNGTVELLLDVAMRTLAAEGARYVTLGLAPLSRHSRYDSGDLPLWLRFVLGWVRVHGRRFYNFEGLDRFKAKFQPETWEEIVAIDDRRPFSPRALYAIAAAFGGRAPITLGLLAVARAVRQEVRWLIARMRRPAATAPRA